MAKAAGLQVNCLNGLLILAAFFFSLAGFSGICGGVMYGTSHMFGALSSTYLVNRTTASNFTRRLDAKLDSLREGSAARGKLLREMAMITFYVTGGLAAPGIIFLFLAGVEACRTYINSFGEEPPEPEPPPAVVTSESKESISCCATACCADSDTCCAMTCAAPDSDCCCCCRSVCCQDSETCCAI